MPMPAVTRRTVKLGRHPLAVAEADHDALKRLDAFPVALPDPKVDPHRVAREKRGMRGLASSW